MEDNKINKFGARSPSPARGATFGRGMGPSAGSVERKISAPASMSSGLPPPAPYGIGTVNNGTNGSNNGSNSDMQCFMNLLEREESDFVEQVKKSKAFIQSVIRNVGDLVFVS